MRRYLEAVVRADVDGVLDFVTQQMQMRDWSPAAQQHIIGVMEELEACNACVTEAPPELRKYQEPCIHL